MRLHPLCLALAPLLTLALAAPAEAQNRRNQQANPELQRCNAPVGTVAIEDAPVQWWREYGLGNPEALIKMMAQRSNCLRVVDRGRGLAMREGERDLAASGELRRGSNVGRGQVVAADFVIVPDIVGRDRNAGGTNVGGIVGGMVGGRAGAVLGGVRTRRMEAHTLITLVDLRTTEQLYVAEGQSNKTDFSFAAGGGRGGAWGGGGGYADTEIGKVVSAAYVLAFNDLVGYMRGMSGNASEAAGLQAYRVTATLELKRSPAASSSSLREFQPGDLVYPTGAREGMWWEVEDEHGNAGWVMSDKITARD